LNRTLRAVVHIVADEATPAAASVVISQNFQFENFTEFFERVLQMHIGPEDRKISYEEFTFCSGPTWSSESNFQFFSL